MKLEEFVCDSRQSECDNYARHHHGPKCTDGCLYCKSVNSARAAGTKVTIGMGEIRTTSSTGGQKGVKPERYSLLPKPALDELARLYNEGAKKYAAHNWRRGYEWSKSYDSLMRHAGDFWEGQDIDPETGCSNMAGVAFHAFALLTFIVEHPEFDDRRTTLLAREAELATDVDIDRNEYTYLVQDPEMPGLPEHLQPGGSRYFTAGHDKETQNDG